MIKRLVKKLFSTKLECLGIICVSFAVFVDKSFGKSKKNTKVETKKNIKCKSNIIRNILKGSMTNKFTIVKM